MLGIDFGDFDPGLIWLWITTTGLQILIIIVLAIVAYRLLVVGTRHLATRVMRLDDEEDSQRDKRVATISGLFRTTGLVIILATALLMILDQLGIAIGPILASVGLLSLALGLGAQTLVKDVISGLFIIMEDQYHIDEVIEFDGRIGTVEKITLRTTQVRDFKGYLHIIPNGDIRLVTNRTRGWSRAVLDVGISYEDDIDHALKTLEAVGEKAQQDPDVGPLLLEEPMVTGVEGLEDWNVRLRLIVKTKPNQHWLVQRYLRKWVKEAFPDAGISIAFPRQEVFIIQGSSEEDQGQ